MKKIKNLIGMLISVLLTIFLFVQISISDLDGILEHDNLLAYKVYLNWNGIKPQHLLRATDYRSDSIVKYLIKKGVDINFRSETNSTALIVAAKDESLSLVEYLLLNGAETEDYDYDGNNALLYAVENKNFEIVKLLVENGADINARDSYGRSSLMLSLVDSSPNYDVTELLLSYDADIHIRDSNGINVLSYAFDTDLQNILLDMGINDFNDNFLDHRIEEAIKEDSVTVLKSLINSGIDIHSKDMSGKSPLIIAARYNSINIAKYLIDIGCDLNLKTEWIGSSAIMNAVSWGNFDFVKLLVESGADINIANRDGHNSLFEAVNSNNVEIVNYLIDMGISINHEDLHGRNILHYAAMKERFNFIELLLESGVDSHSIDKNLNTVLMNYAVNSYNIEICRLLISTGIDVNAVNRFGQTALDISNISSPSRGLGYTNSENDDIQELLAGFSRDIGSTTSKGNSAIACAIKTGNIESVKALLKYDINLDKVSDIDRGTKAIHMAVNINSIDMIKLLVEKGVKLDTLDSNYDTPLMKAIEYGYFEIAEYLLKKGARIDIKNDQGKDALEMAKKYKHTKFVDLIILHNKKGVDK